MKNRSITDNKVFVGHTTTGKPLSLKELKKRVAKAETRMNKREFITHEDLEKEVDKW